MVTVCVTIAVVVAEMRKPFYLRRVFHADEPAEAQPENQKTHPRRNTLPPSPLDRLASAVLSEISDDWETGRAYLNVGAG